MSGIPTLLADAVTAVLNAAVEAESFESLTEDELERLTIRRSYPDWDDDFKDLKSLAVDVVFVASNSDVVDLDSETTLSSEPAIDVAVRMRFAATDRETSGRLKNAVVDKYVHLVEEIYQKLSAVRSEPLAIPGLSANWLDTSVRTYCDYKRLREGNFLGVVRMRYDASRAG